MKKLRISDKLSLPADAVTSTIVVYGGKGMGKTNLANVLVEEFAEAGLRFAVIDPMGVWWGLRHGADGKSRGIKVLILGGIYGDLPITPESGALVADLVVDEDASVIIDISRRADGSMWAISERIRFVRDYAKRLYQRQGEKRRPINQVIDEAARFAPQIIRTGESDVAACMGAIAVLVEEGRNVGVGVTLVTQRSARLNKDVAELADCMIAFRIVGPNSMRAVLDWLGEHVEKSRLKEIGEKLRSLPRGSALVVSPGWLEFEGIIAMRKRTTFDSSKTPEGGGEARAIGAGATIDLEKYRGRLATLLEEQKANDPKALRARVAELERELKAKVPKTASPKVVEKSIIKAADLSKISALTKNLVSRSEAMQRNADALAVAAVNAREAAKILAEIKPPTSSTTIVAAPSSSALKLTTKRYADGSEITTRSLPPELRNEAIRMHQQQRPRIGAPSDTAHPLERRQLKVLEAIAWWEAIGINKPGVVGVAFIASYSPISSSFEKIKGALRTSGLVDYPSPGEICLTEAGRTYAPTPSRPSSRADLHAAVLDKVEPRYARLLQPLLVMYPQPMAMPALAEDAGYSVDSSSFEKIRGALRTLGLVEYPKPGYARAADFLFPEGS